jgi:gluconate 2-dehydrogenase subunit 3-like protein
MKTPDPVRIDRRLAIKWIVAAGAGAMVLKGRTLRAAQSATAAGAAATPAAGYGTDPDLMKPYKPGDFWPLTFTDAERRAAAALCDIIMPADDRSPSASSAGVTDFVDEWVSAPYPDNVRDRTTVMDGLAWLDGESMRRFNARFRDAAQAQREALCADISAEAPRDSELGKASRFFRKFRDLVASGYYTTPVGMKELGYVGNIPLARFDGPPADLVARLGLSDEVKW